MRKKHLKEGIEALEGFNNLLKKTIYPLHNNKLQFMNVGIDRLKNLDKVDFQYTLGLIALGKWAEKEHIKGPKDLSTNHNTYIYGE